MNSQAGLQVLYSQVEIGSTIKRLTSEITAEYHDKYPLLLGVLKGCFVFMADLVRMLDFPLEVEFIRLSSYGGGQESSGKVKVVQGLKTDVVGRHVLVVEDIVDTGITAAFLLGYLKKKKPASVRLPDICVLEE